MKSYSHLFLLLLASLISISHGFSPTTTRIALGVRSSTFGELRPLATPFRRSTEQLHPFRLERHAKRETTDGHQSLPDNLSGGLAFMLLPISSLIDNITGGWGMTYADLTPETHQTPNGVAFLATNLAYTLAGGLLSFHGDNLLGFLIECASVASFAYHFTQLKLGPNQAAVRLALLVDYIIAGAGLITGTIYIVLSPYDMPVEGWVCSALGVACLGASWVWEKGTPYIVFHGMWHLLSAYGGYMIGQAHLAHTATAMI